MRKQCRLYKNGWLCIWYKLTIGYDGDDFVNNRVTAIMDHGFVRVPRFFSKIHKPYNGNIPTRFS